MDGRRFTIRYGLAATGLLAAWAAVAYVVAPRVIREAYAGRSHEALNRLITGQAGQPVDRYLELWSGLALKGTLALVALIGLIYVLWLLRAPLRRVLGSVFQREPRIAAQEAIVLSVWLGLVAGMVEVGARFVKFQFVGAFSKWSNPDTVWMAPLATAGLFFVIGLGLVAIVGVRRRVGLAPFLFALVGLGTYGVIRVLELGIYPIAAAVLALGVAVQVNRWAAARAPGLLRVVRLTTGPALGAFVALAVLMNPGSRLLERIALRDLPEGGDRPNVLLIVWDTVRNQSLSLHGYPRSTTPELEALAQTSVVFDQAIATSPWTLPSHGSLFTGRHHHELTTDFESPMDATHPTLAEALSERGYATGGFVANLLYTTRQSGLDRGFVRYDDYPVSARVFLSSAWLTQKLADWVRRRVPGRRALLVRKYAWDINREFLDWVDGLEGRPFFAFLNYFDAHLPYERYDEYVARFPAEPPRDSVFIAPGEYRTYQRGAQRVIEAYDSSIALMDDYLGRLLDELEARGLRDNTLVIVTSDHGEQLGEHGLTEHANSLYMPLLKIPLLVSLPGTIPEGVRVEEWVTNRAVPSTVLEIVDGRADPTWPGGSLSRYWRQPDADLPQLDPLLSEVNPNPFRPELPGPRQLGPMKSLIRNGVHYIRNGNGTEEVYDLAIDPWEERDLADQPMGQALLPAFREALVRALGEHATDLSAPDASAARPRP